jgi:hypothetical protein
MNELTTQLAQEILTEYRAAEGAALACRQNVTDAVTHASRCGEMLIEAQTVLRGSFGAWLADHCNEITLPAAKRFISGAKKMRERGGLPDPRQMLMFFSDEPTEERKQIARDPDGTNWLTDLSKVCERINKTLDHRPPVEWTEQERDVFKLRMKPLVELYNQI